MFHVPNYFCVGASSARSRHLQKLFIEKNVAEETLSKESLEDWDAELAQLVKKRGPRGTHTTALKTVYGPKGKFDVKKVAQKQKRVQVISFVSLVKMISSSKCTMQCRSTIDYRRPNGPAMHIDSNSLAACKTASTAARCRIDRARKRGVGSSSRNVKGGSAIGGMSTGGYMPLGFKCDDYIQDSVIDKSTRRGEHTEGGKGWTRCASRCRSTSSASVCASCRTKCKVSFKDKDLRNTDDADIVIAFRADVPNSGAGTEQTLNYALFGEYAFLEQFKNDKKAGGALLRDGMITNPGDDVKWREEQYARIPSPGLGDEATSAPRVSSWQGVLCVEDTHTTPKDGRSLRRRVVNASRCIT